MKKLWIVCAVIVLAAAAVLLALRFQSSPDQRLRAQVPAKAEQLLYLDLGGMLDRNPSPDICQEELDKLKKKLQEKGLPESLLRSRGILFGCAREKWGGALLQSRGDEARQLYEYLQKETQGDKNTRNFQISERRGGRGFSADCAASAGDCIGVCVTLYGDDLVMVVLQQGKADPARFRPGRNTLADRLTFKDMFFSLAAKIALPDTPEVQQFLQKLHQVVPALRKLETVFAAVPAGEAAKTTTVRLNFADATAATQMSAVIDMFSGMAGQSNPELAQIASWKTDGKTLILSLDTKQTAAVMHKAMEQSRRRAQQIASINHLKQIATGIHMYASSHSDKLPPSLAALTRGGYLPPNVLIAPADSRRLTASGKPAAPGNTSYIYLGSGLKTEASPRLPVALEKPDLIGADGRCAVLFLDGHVETRTVRGRTCRAIAEELLDQCDAPEEAKRIVLLNASAADREL